MFSFFIAFIFVFIMEYVAAKVPSYIHVCGRRDPNLDQCILNNIENLKNKICDGIPELDIESNNPMVLDKLIIFDSPDSKLHLEDTKLTGLCDFLINDLHMNIDKLHFDVDLSFNKIYLNGTYDLNLHLIVPIAYKSQYYITSDNVRAKVNADLKLETINDQNYVYLSKIIINLDIKGYTINIANHENLQQLTQIVRNFIGNNQEVIIKTIKPIIEEIISKRIILVSNKIVKHFTYEELFPDRM